MVSIYLLPYGGGSASSYRAYARRYPKGVARVTPVDIPGRGSRSHETPATSIEACAALALQDIDPTSGAYIVHGHCMGALLAFEAIKLIESSGRPLPLLMVASGRNAPRHVNDWLRRVPSLDDRSLFAQMQQLGGIPRGFSFAMAEGFLGALRNDQAMIRQYRPGPSTISVPILVLAGRDDQMTTPDALEEWRDYTSNTVSIEWLEGRHYALLEQPDRVAALIEAHCRVAT